MKTKFDKLLLTLVIFITMFFMVTFLTMKKVNFSYVENRYLADFSINNIEKYISDHFPYRDSLITLKNKFKIIMGKTFINNVYIGKDNYLIPNFTDNDKKNLIVDSINKFALNNSNVDVLIVPDSILINEDKLHYHLPIFEDKEIINLYSKLHNVNSIDITNQLKKANKESNNMYYKTDHHWTTYGAFVAYQEYCKTKGINAFNKNDFNIIDVNNNFLGTSSSIALGIGKPEKMTLFLKNESLTVEYVYEKKQTETLYNYEYLKEKDKYSIFLDNNHALIKITNNLIDNDSSIILIKNSYANSFTPFIVNNYKNVYLIDLRYYSNNTSNFIKSNNIKDILILYNLNNLYSDMSIIKLK